MRAGLGSKKNLAKKDTRPKIFDACINIMPHTRSESSCWMADSNMEKNIKTLTLKILFSFLNKILSLFL